MSAKSPAQILAELRSIARSRRRAALAPGAAPLLARLIAGARAVSIEERANGVTFQIHPEAAATGPPVLSCVLHHSHHTQALTAAEADVAAHLCEGRTLAQIARLRGVSANTVKSQVRQIFRKINVDSRVALVRRLCP